MSIDQKELLDQFVLEARECLEQVGRRLLEIERAPGDAEKLADLFRQVHTLKGNCGLFEFKALERVVHAGEDLLDAVRNGAIAYGPALADTLLDGMDYAGQLIDAIAATGHLPAGVEGEAERHAAALRTHLQPAAAGAGPAAAGGAAGAGAPPAWLQAVPATLRGTGRLALRYRPEPECFFKGEDPWRLALGTPGLVHVAVAPLSPWPEAETFDCYRCNLELVIVADAPRPYVDDHFRYVPEQVECVDFCPAAPAPAAAGAPAAAADVRAAELLHQRVAALWQQQVALLARPALAAGTVAAVRTALAHLSAALGQALPAPPPADAHALLGWARAQAGAAVAAATDAAPSAAADAPAEARGATAAAPPAAPADEAAGQKVVKVAQEKVDRLMDLIGEMVVAKNALPYLADRAEAVFGQRELAREIKTQYSVINRIAEDMQHAIMQVRMLPVGVVFQRFGRLVRDLSRKLGKEVRLVVEGEATEADKTVIESLADPLIHILRNSLDHGIETPAVRRAAGKPPQGELRVSARQEGDRVLLEIRDDGAGVDTARVRAKAVERGLIPADRAETLSEAEAVQLVFLPGFSTADAVSDLSGRGVGMDVVRSAVERVNGTVQLSSVRGQGTTILLALPLSMAVTHVMTIEAGGRRFGVPMDLIVETVRVPAEDIHAFKNARTAVLRGRVVPLQTLADLLGLDEPPRLNDNGEHAVLVVRLGRETIGVVVDDFHGTSDIILKPLDGVLAALAGFAGTALMGDGSVLMILNPKELL
jgi:two-component system chemotaxis sensor kinase CheA